MGTIFRELLLLNRFLADAEYFPCYKKEPIHVTFNCFLNGKQPPNRWMFNFRIDKCASGGEVRNGAGEAMIILWLNYDRITHMFRWMAWCTRKEGRKTRVRFSDARADMKEQNGKFIPNELVVL